MSTAQDDKQGEKITIEKKQLDDIYKEINFIKETIKHLTGMVDALVELYKNKK